MTEQEYLLLCELSYKDYDLNNQNTIAKMFEGYKNQTQPKDKPKSEEQLIYESKLANIAYGMGNWQLISAQPNTSSGLSAI